MLWKDFPTTDWGPGFLCHWHHLGEMCRKDAIGGAGLWPGSASAWGWSFCSLDICCFIPSWLAGASPRGARALGFSTGVAGCTHGRVDPGWEHMTKNMEAMARCRPGGCLPDWVSVDCVFTSPALQDSQWGVLICRCVRACVCVCVWGGALPSEPRPCWLCTSAPPAFTGGWLGKECEPFSNWFPRTDGSLLSPDPDLSTKWNRSWLIR